MWRENRFGDFTSFPVGTCLASLTLAKFPLPIVLSSLYLPMCGSSDERLRDDPRDMTATGALPVLPPPAPPPPIPPTAELLLVAASLPCNENDNHEITRTLDSDGKKRQHFVFGNLETRTFTRREDIRIVNKNCSYGEDAATGMIYFVGVQTCAMDVVPKSTHNSACFPPPRTFLLRRPISKVFSVSGDNNFSTEYARVR